jgi:putative transcriptional regulator
MTVGLQLDDLLIAHAAGKLAEPVALVVATHLALAPASRRRYRRYEALGGVLLEGVTPAPLADDAWERMLGRLDAPARPEAVALPPPGPAAGLPAPLRPYLPQGPAALAWHSYGALQEADLGLGGDYRVQLIRLKAGRRVPRHTHDGNELTVVLEGAFSDGVGHYRRGDLAIADGSIDHRPMADPDGDCLCLAVTDAPIRLTGPIGRFLNPFLRV